MPASDPFQQLKVLGEPQRLAILRRLMAGPATLSQLGLALHTSPAHIRHHLKALEHAGFVELDSVNLVRNLWEKYYRASAAAYSFDLVLLPDLPEGQVPLVIGSNDLALQRLPAGLDRKSMGVTPRVLALDSLDGLVRLRAGACQMASCHLLDPDSGEYNRGFVRHMFPGRTMALVHLYHREVGLLVQPGNPKRLHTLADLVQTGVRMINRERGSGVRVWLDDQLCRTGILPAALVGYSDEAASHREVAQAVQAGQAEAGLGLPTSAQEAGLDFIPLFEEPYDLVLSPETLADARLAAFFEYLTSGEFRGEVEQIGGYHLTAEFGTVEMVA